MSNTALFEKYRKHLIGQRVTHVWRGYGSALFIEFGHLTPYTKRDGSPGNSRGEFSIMIEWSWRIENMHEIICGSWSDEYIWEHHFQQLIGRFVEDISFFGRLPELCLSLSDHRWIYSFQTSEGDPAWVIFHKTQGTCLSLENGSFVEETSEKPAS